MFAEGTAQRGSNLGIAEHHASFQRSDGSARSSDSAGLLPGPGGSPQLVGGHRSPGFLHKATESTPRPKGASWPSPGLQLLLVHVLCPLQKGVCDGSCRGTPRAGLGGSPTRPFNDALGNKQAAGWGCGGEGKPGFPEEALWACFK